MNNLLLTYSLLFSVAFCHAQNLDFTLADPQPDLIEVYEGSFGSGDIDGDLDLVMAGLDPGRETALYFNDGNGNFTEEVDIPFPEASGSVPKFKDLDGDGDLDLFFCGIGFGIHEFAHVYLNDGLGGFTQLPNPALPQFGERGVAIEDMDGDGDPDIVIFAMDADDVFFADVFLNDGNAIFSPSGNTAFIPVQFGVVATIDVENDGDLDIIASGSKEDGMALTALYLNDGMGNFSADTDNVFVQLSANDVDVADTDNDGDMDILMSGATDSFGVFTLLYANDGNGQFTEIETDLQDTFAGANAIADLDNDGDQDILIIGSQAGGIANIFNIVYENIGDNVFMPTDTIGGEYIAACIIDNFNGDDLKDIIIQGFVDDTNVYWNASTITNLLEQDITSLLTIYPNPSAGQFTLLLDETTPVADLSIFTSQGRLVHQQLNLTGKSNVLNLDLERGHYIAQVRFGHTTVNNVLIIGD
jgi:hypothetical protein